MNQSPVNERIVQSLRKHADMVRRISYIYLRNQADVEDVFQEVFLKLLQNQVPFKDAEHEKAWLIRVTINKCKDVIKSFWHRKTESIEGIELPVENETESELLEVVFSLPAKYKDAIYLFYYEEYQVSEIASILGQKEGTIYSNLHRARNMIKQKLGEEENAYAL